jgi:hypothetical protein
VKRPGHEAADRASDQDSANATGAHAAPHAMYQVDRPGDVRGDDMLDLVEVLVEKCLAEPWPALASRASTGRWPMASINASTPSSVARSVSLVATAAPAARKSAAAVWSGSSVAMTRSKPLFAHSRAQGKQGGQQGNQGNQGSQQGQGNEGDRDRSAGREQQGGGQQNQGNQSGQRQDSGQGGGQQNR